ncbi:MAG: hypothetical protein IPO64_09310 [Bacteroidetes bacterium]|nr:hypothetical protein [Bacteroidota bacterium]
MKIPKSLLWLILITLVSSNLLAQNLGNVDSRISVSESGGAIFSLPINMPSGTVLTPELNFVYNSQMRNSNYGYGWQLNGLSEISYDEGDLFHDGAASPIDISNGGFFQMNGQRLIVTNNGIYGNNATEYGTEVESFTKTTSFGSYSGCSKCPQYFQMKTKNGIVFEYGNSTDSKVKSNDNTRPIKWLLNKMYDNYGNYVEYKYININGQQLIDEINYTGNAATGLLPYNKVKFTYTIRTDKNSVFISGSSTSITELKENNLLSKITITTENNILFKEYYFNYQTNGRYSFLASIQDESQQYIENFSFPHDAGILEFSTNLNTTTSDILLNQAVLVLNGDFDGDGKEEIFAANYTGSGLEKVFSSYKVIKLISGTWQEIYNGTLVTSEGGQTIYMGFGVGDIDGNGNDDIVLYRKKKNCTSPCTITNYEFANISVLYSNNVGMGFTKTDYPINLSKAIKEENNGLLGDYDGDGRIDLITKDLNGINRIHFIAKNQYNVNLGIGDIDFSGLNFNGDSKDEVYRASAVEVKSVNNNAGVYSLQTIASYPNQDYHIDKISGHGDFNGDNKEDLIVPTENGLYQILYSTGFSYLVKPMLFPYHFQDQAQQSAEHIYGESFLTGDFNGDGKEDIIHHYYVWDDRVPGFDKHINEYMNAYLSNGMDFTREEHRFTDLDHIKFLTKLVMDVDGDGDMELIGFTELSSFPWIPGNKMKIYDFESKRLERLTGHIEDNFNNSIEIYYYFLSSNGPYQFNPPNTNSYPFLRKTIPLTVVSFISKSGENTELFTYKNAIIHQLGKGFLGFESIITSNWQNNITKTVNYTLNTVFAENIFQNSIVNNGSFVVSTTNQAFSLVGLNANKRYWIRKENAESQDYLTNRNEKNAFTYDAYGNITQQIQNINNGYHIKTINTTYGQFGSFIPSKPTQITISNQRIGSAIHNEINKKFYNSNGSIIQDINYFGQPNAITTDYTYDAFGNKLIESVSSAGISTRTITKTYSANGRFLSSLKNPLNQTTSFTYDTRWGKLKSITGIDGLITQYEFDVFGELNKVIPPAPKNPINISIQFSSTPTNCVYKKTISQVGMPTTISYFDSKDRIIYQSTEGFNQTITEEKNYDTYGNLIKEKSTNANNTGFITKDYTYDIYKRIIQASTTGIGNTTYGYGISTQPYTTITQPNGVSKTTYFDGFGNKTKIVENGLQNVYTFNSQDLLTKIELDNIEIFNATYDVYGNQITLADKDAGSYAYEYNSLGELTKQTDPKGNITEQTFDALGRITNKTLKEVGLSPAPVLYEYVTSGNGINNLWKISGYNGLLTTYSYDNFGRPITWNENFEGQNYATNLSYDLNDRIISKTFPSGFGLNYNYDSKGYLSTIKNLNNTKTIFTTNEINAFDQYKKYTLGNAKNTQITYNDYGTPTKIFSANIINQNYTWDITNGNLLSRNDQKRGLTETFTYDNFERLTGTQLGSATPNLITYDPNGNILSKYDAGSEYLYDANKIHAVTNIKSKIFSPTSSESCDISTLQQDINYNIFNQPTLISEGTGTSLVKSLSFGYNSNQERIKTTYKENNTTKTTRYFFGNYEKDITNGTTREIHYINAGQAGLVAILVKQGATETYYYVYKDHLGSIITLTNGAGTSVAEQSFDAYGRNRNPNNWTYNNIPVPPVWLYRGYTGHEELDKFGLINMNGRLYDPVVGRMLSPDNNVTDESNCQNYNRYSYVLNNPLKYIDPTGEDWDDYDDGYDGSVPPEHHVEDGILYQDVYYLGDHGMEHYSIPVGSEVSTGSNESGYEETLMEDMYESTYEENEREEVLDTKEEDGIKPTGTIYIDESIPDDLLEQIVIIPEDVDNDPLIYVDEPGKYKGDGIFFKYFSNDKYWYKVPGGSSVTISFDPKKKEFNFKFDKSEFWGGVFELLDKPYIHGFININDPRPNDIRNPFEE